VRRAQALGYAAIAITDACSLAGVVRAHVEALACGMKLIIGAEMRLTLPEAEGGGSHARLVLLAQDRRGYANLSLWITLARRRAGKGAYLAFPGDIEGRAPTAPALAGLPGCLALLVPSAGQPPAAVLEHARWLQRWITPDADGRARAAIALELLHRPGDDALRATVCTVAARTGLPVVAAGDVLMHVRSHKPLQDVLTATRLKRTVAECGLDLAGNAEQHLRPRSRLARLYDEAWMRQAVEFASRCTFSLAELKYEYPREIVPAGETPTSWLRKLVYSKAPERLAASGGLQAWEAQIEKELALIRQLEYEAYFLTVTEIVHWARDQHILCQGRGSAANSLVCFCLGITEVEPRESKLLFERFISAERAEPPDIDVDFEHQQRERVIQHIYAKYGRHRAALTAVVITYRSRSAVRDVGRALGIDEQRIAALAKSQQWFDGRRFSPERLRENGFDPDAPVVRRWGELTQQLIGFPRHLSQHPGGFVIARDWIEQLVPVENAAMEGRVVVQWDKDDLDALRLIKVDILALGMLSAIRRALEFVGRKRGTPLAMRQIPHGDVPTYDMICRADTIGVFQIESRAQMSMLPRLKPRCYYDLVVEVAIVRPGPIQGGMVHPYLKNRGLKDEQIDYPKSLHDALARTKGVPIFQEQVMQIAMIAADFTPGEADQLRRAMAAWKRKGGLEPFREKLVGRMLAKQYDPAFAESIFKQIQGFGEYGFPESHAAGFAQLAYFSSWLKCHHPDAFLAALLNSQPLGFYAPAQLVRDAREHGVVVRPADVSASDWASTLEGAAGQGAALLPVRLGLDRIAGLSQEAGERIVAARIERHFDNVEDLARRAALDAHALRALASADALRSVLARPPDASHPPPAGAAPGLGSGPAPGLASHRHQAAWAVAGIDTRPTSLLRQTRVHEVPAVLAAPAEVEDTLADYRTLGLTLGRHPVALLRDELAAFKVQPAAVLKTYPHGRLARASGLVTHRQRPETAKGTIFVTLEDETGAVNIIVWPRVAEAQRRPLLGARLLTVYGQWQREGEVMHLVAGKLIDHTPLLQGLAAHSRDFR
jgi:error-prone DNA polymerase